MVADPRLIKLKRNQTPYGIRVTAKGKCSYCGKWFSLVHKTKQYPFGSNLHDHQVGGRTCFGIPTFRANP